MTKKGVPAWAFAWAFAIVLVLCILNFVLGCYNAALINPERPSGIMAGTREFPGLKGSHVRYRGAGSGTADMTVFIIARRRPSSVMATPRKSASIGGLRSMANTVGNVSFI